MKRKEGLPRTHSLPSFSAWVNKGFDLQPLQDMLVDLNRRFKRGKVFDQGRVQGRLVAALDGIEVLSSFSRRCENCLERRVTRKDQAGRNIEETQY